MKKIVLIFIFSILPCSAIAQGLYLDAGLGVDYNISTIIYNDDDIDNSYFSYTGINIGFKAGYGPFSGVPVYFVLGYENIYGPIGPGVIFYPTPLVQLGSSIGLTIDMGFAWDISTAIDFGKNNHGILLGIKYWGLTQEHRDFIDYGDIMVNNAFGIFVKYVYRRHN
jgi:hypothetical protein